MRLAAVVALAVLAPACRPATVRVSFRPAEGARYAYDVRVASESVVELDGRPSERRSDEIRFRAEHTVLEAGSQGSRVEVRLAEADGRGGTPRTFVVRLDRAAQLVRVERVEGVPSGTLGELGLSEIFPEAAAAAPDRPLAPGERWAIDKPVELPGITATRLRGWGRVAELGVEDGREVAMIDTRTDLPVTRETVTAESTLQLDGRQTTMSSAVHSLGDGAIERLEARTRGEYGLELRPSKGDVRPLRGRIVVEVRSWTRRLRGALETSRLRRAAMSDLGEFHQDNVGYDNMKGGGEWPSKDTPPEGPAPGTDETRRAAIEAERSGESDDSGDTSGGPDSE